MHLHRELSPDSILYRETEGCLLLTEFGRSFLQVATLSLSLSPPMEEKKKEKIVINQMRELMAKMGSSAERYGDEMLLRFLIARSMDPEKATKMLLEWERWRIDITPKGYIDEVEIADELAYPKAYLHGPTKDGCPILIVQARHHFPSKDYLQFKKYVVYLLDKTIARSFEEKEVGNEKLVAILDLQSLALKNIDVQALITGFQFLQGLLERVAGLMCTKGQSYYPERLAKFYIISMPWIFVGVWKVVSAFLDKATLQKLMRTLLDVIEPNLYTLTLPGLWKLWIALLFCFQLMRTLLDVIGPNLYTLTLPGLWKLWIALLFFFQIAIVRTEKEKSEMIEEIGKDGLPKDYGGRTKLTAIQDLRLNHWPSKA